MILSDSMILQEIKAGNIIIDGFKKEHLNPNSVDLTLAPNVKIYPKEKEHVETYDELPDWVKIYGSYNYNGIIGKYI
jgi:deoxycytidine triphosphate deaminase